MNAYSQLKSAFGLTALGVVALTSLSGCVVSDDPAVNALATTAAIGTVASLIYYSNDDGYYYDDGYNRMPRGYRPAYNTSVRRIDSMADYRRSHPLNTRMMEQREQNRMLQDRLDRQREQNRQLQNRVEQQRIQNADMRQRLDNQRQHNEIMRERIDSQRMPQQRVSEMQPRFEQRQQTLPQMRQIPVRTQQNSGSRNAPWWEQNRYQNRY